MRRALPWFPVSIDLPHHPKTIRLAATLDIPREQAVGILVCVWAWFAREQQDGKFRGSSAESARKIHGSSAEEARKILATACGISAEVLSALIDTHWLDESKESLSAHDWTDHAGHYIEKAEKERARKANFERAEIPRKARGNSAAIPRLDGDGDGDGRDIEKKEPLAAGAAPSPKKSKHVGHPRFASVCELLTRLLTDLLGQPYHFSGSADGGAVNRLLAYPEATDAEIERRLRSWMADPFNVKNAKVVTFAAAWSSAGARKAVPAVHPNGEVRCRAVTAEDAELAYANPEPRS